MTEPAVLRATYSDFKFIKTRKTLSLSFEVPIEHADAVHAVLGMPNPEAEKWVAIAVLGRHGESEGDSHSPDNLTPEGAVSAPPAKGPHSDYAQKLYQSYFMRNVKVCEALGTDEEYREWIQGCASCISDKYDYTEDGPKCEATHVRRAGQSGTGYKAPYSCVPLAHAEHQQQHQLGELAALLPHALASTPQEAKEWFNKQAIKYRERWAKMRLCDLFGVGSLTEIEPSRIQAWAVSCDVEEALPK